MIDLNQLIRLGVRNPHSLPMDTLVGYLSPAPEVSRFHSAVSPGFDQCFFGVGIKAADCAWVNQPWVQTPFGRLLLPASLVNRTISHTFPPPPFTLIVFQVSSRVGTTQFREKTPSTGWKGPVKAKSQLNDCVPVFFFDPLTPAWDVFYRSMKVRSVFSLHAEEISAGHISPNPTAFFKVIKMEKTLVRILSIFCAGVLTSHELTDRSVEGCNHRRSELLAVESP